MPFWDRSLDLVVSTHPDADHLTGLVEVLNRYKVGGWLDAGSGGNDALMAQAEKLLRQKEIPRAILCAGASLDLGDGVALSVLNPPCTSGGTEETNTNNRSVVTRVSWGLASFVLTGDIEAEAERRLVESGQLLQGQVLKVAHHGSAGSSTQSFLRAVGPRVAVISVGAENKSGHPAEQVLRRLAEQEIPYVYRTDQQGTIEFATDGERLWIKSER
jgi:competence protein ComEC